MSAALEQWLKINYVQSGFQDFMKLRYEKMTLYFAEPTELLLEVNHHQCDRTSWQNSQIYGTPHSRWCAYINQICLDVVFNWIKNEYVPDAAVWYRSAGIPSFWEFVNGVGNLFWRAKK